MAKQQRLLKENSNLNLEGLEDFYEEHTVSEPTLPILAKVAVGILTWPVAQLSKAERFKPHVIRKVFNDGKTTTAIEWEVTPHPKLGMPTMLSLRLLLVLCKLASDHKIQSSERPNWLPLPSWNEVCRIIGIEPSGGNRRLLKQHLQVLHSTLISSKRAFKTSRRTEGISDKFILVPSIQLKGEPDSEGIPSDQTYIKLADPLLESIDNDYVKTIDLAFMTELGNEAAQLLYTKVSYLLHKALKNGKEYEDFDYEWLIESMGLAPCKTKGLAKKQLIRAFNALSASAYIQTPEWWVGRSWKIRLRPDVRFKFGEQLQLQIRKDKASFKKIAKPKASFKQPEKLHKPTLEDIRDSALIREAARINLGSKPNIDVLTKHSWTMADAEAKAMELKTLD